MKRENIGFVAAGMLYASVAFGDLAGFVDPFVGTAGTGHTTPAACCPLGMVQAGPDTGNEDWNHCSGYVYGDKRIFGFSQTHLNGTGCPDLGDILILPDATSNGLEYDKSSEAAAPGWYAVTLANGARVEVAAAEHSAIYRITYSGEGRKQLLVDCQWGTDNQCMIGTHSVPMIVDWFLKEHWKNVFDPSFGLVRGRDSQGNWREPFDPYELGHGADSANDFTEGNAFQYTWHVMQDVLGIVAAMGGRDRFVASLDSLFKTPSKTEGMGEVLDVTGLIGQYVHGNEPSHHVIYFYPQIGQHDKAAERIREVFDRFYLPKPDGLCGNDDCGQMSAWYLFSAMGFYPFNPCGGEYIIGAPQVPRATLNLANGKTFTMTAKSLSKENKYVKSATLNGKPITNWKIRHADIMKGSELAFEMTAK